MLYQIYKITNIINGKIYIGKTTKSLRVRWIDHCAAAKNGKQYRLSHAIRKYGPEQFTIEIIDTVKSKNHLDHAEQFWIKEYKSQDPEFGYNMTEGGDGVQFTEEVKMKIAMANKLRKPPNLGRKFSEESRRKMSLAKRGKPQTWESNRKRSAGMKRYLERKSKWI